VNQECSEGENRGATSTFFSGGTLPHYYSVTPLRDRLATPQRELTRKDQTDRFDVIIHAEHVVHRRGYYFHFGCMFVCLYVC